MKVYLIFLHCRLCTRPVMTVTLHRGIMMIAFKSKENHCVGKLQCVLSNIFAISSRSENDMNAFQATRKHKALNKLLNDA